MITVAEAEDGGDGGDEKNEEKRDAASFHRERPKQKDQGKVDG